jgi:hypothetical protein
VVPRNACQRTSMAPQLPCLRFSACHRRDCSGYSALVQKLRLTAFGIRFNFPWNAVSELLQKVLMAVIRTKQQASNVGFMRLRRCEAFEAILGVSFHCHSDQRPHFDYFGNAPAILTATRHIFNACMYAIMAMVRASQQFSPHAD